MEMIDVYNKNNEFLGYSKTRDEVHEENLFHRHVSAWIMNYEGKILLQQRAFTKKKNPGKWAKTGGHVDAGESCIDALKREIKEEIGLNITDIEEINVFKSENPNYFSHNYIVFTNLNEEEFILQKEEVNSVKYYDIEELESYKKDNNKDFTFCKWDDDDFYNQMNILKEYRNKIKELGQKK